jgi:hypothetical protein
MRRLPATLSLARRAAMPLSLVKGLKFLITKAQKYEKIIELRVFNISRFRDCSKIFSLSGAFNATD